MPTLAERLRAVYERIRTAEAQAGRKPGSVRLLAVGKKQPAATIEQAYKLGQVHFGENYLQEALPKIQQLAHPDLKLDWHFIGRIQSNKTRAVGEHFNWVHSVDRFKVAKRLNDQRPENFKPLNICLQVNLDGEAGKGGLTPGETREVAEAVAELPALRLRGLMAIPAATNDPAVQRENFRRLRLLRETLIRHGLELDTLSMGMSADLEAAILEGATIVRVGTAIFGPRPDDDR